MRKVYLLLTILILTFVVCVRTAQSRCFKRRNNSKFQISTERIKSLSSKGNLTGTLYITLAVFSGRPDPQWQINKDDSNYQQIKNHFQAAKKKNLTKSFREMPARLGYKGFLIRENNQGPVSLIIGPKTIELQKLLLKTAPVGRGLKRLVRRLLRKEQKTSNSKDNAMSLPAQSSSTPGTLYITLAVFSGRPDPQWQINKDDSNYQQINEHFQDAKKKNLTKSFREMPARLGYKGFLIRENNQGPVSLIIGPKTIELQKLLLKTAPVGPKHLMNRIIEALDKGEI